MFDIGWSELAIVALIALLVIGPKELPATMRMIAGWIGKVRSLAREFQGGLDDMMRETELDKLKEQAQGVMHGDLDTMVENTIDPDGKIRDEFDYGAGYEPFGDFDEPEAKPTPKKRKSAAKPDGAAAVAKTAKAKAPSKTGAKATAKTTAKTPASSAAKAKPGAKAGTETAAKSKAPASTKTDSTKAPSTKTTSAKRAAATKPDASGDAKSDG